MTTEPAQIQTTGLPPILDVKGIRTHLAPLSKSTLYRLATTGEIQSVSLGFGRGTRAFLTQSVADWLNRRIAQTKRPNVKSGSDQSPSPQL